MAGKKKKSTKVGKPDKVKAEASGEGEEVAVEEAIPEEATIKVRCPKRGVRMMTQSQYDAYCKDRDAK